VTNISRSFYLQDGGKIASLSPCVLLSVVFVALYTFTFFSVVFGGWPGKYHEMDIKLNLIGDKMTNILFFKLFPTNGSFTSLWRTQAYINGTTFRLSQQNEFC